MGTGTSLRDRLAIAWSTLRDSENAPLLLEGPLPLWMQDVFETMAQQQGTDVGEVIFNILRDAAKKEVK